GQERQLARQVARSAAQRRDDFGVSLRRGLREALRTKDEPFPRGQSRVRIVQVGRRVFDLERRRLKECGTKRTQPKELQITRSANRFSPSLLQSIDERCARLVLRFVEVT